MRVIEGVKQFRTELKAGLPEKGPIFHDPGIEIIVVPEPACRTGSERQCQRFLSRRISKCASIEPFRDALVGGMRITNNGIRLSDLPDTKGYVISTTAI